MYKLFHYPEHYQGLIAPHTTESLTAPTYQYHFLGKDDAHCYQLQRTEKGYQVQTSYYIGVDWIKRQQTAICVSPKLNHPLAAKSLEIDYIQMLLSCLHHSEISAHTRELFTIKWQAPTIKLPHHQDLLTPLLAVSYLMQLKQLVQKGLKKSYYKVNYNLHGRIKGKILVGPTIKQNILKNKQLNTVCAYDDFGLNHSENRLLKKALTFVHQYLPKHTHSKSLQQLFNFIRPAFENISAVVTPHEIKQLKTTAIYPEYEQALHLAQLILKRFGYSLSHVGNEQIDTPPFWIDMSKLFELYVLGLLKDRFHNQLTYHFSTYGNELDYLLNTNEYQLVIDAKYKPKYQKGLVHQDIRQVSGYARHSKVYQHLGLTYPESINCLIIYPDQENGLSSFDGVALLSEKIPQYKGIYKLPVKLPTIA
ncbi:MAG: 5-methylcytosine restriction system specificity protein McrC [Flammeovirgaceae bacterium]